LKIASIKWYRDRIEHIAKHKIEPYEVEQAAFDDPYKMFKKVATSDGFPGKYVYRLLGRTEAGRHLAFFFIPIEAEVVYPVTARNMNDSERGLYNAHRR